MKDVWISRDQSHRSLLTAARLRGCRDHELQEHVEEIRDLLADGHSELSLAERMFGLACEAARRSLGWELRQNQLQAARHLLCRRIVELPTGEGKTLAVTPALVLRALAGRGAWLATANDYLARRDAVLMTPLFALLDLSVGYLQAAQTPAERRAAYACDITYGTIREFGFDFLRDRLAQRRADGLSGEHQRKVQRELYSIFVDEADSILLDDARTPLIISETRPQKCGHHAVRWSVLTGRALEVEHDYFAEPSTCRIWLTDVGRAKVRKLVEQDLLAETSLPEAYELVSQAIQAEHLFRLNRDYVIRDGSLVIIDRATGRLAEGRAWQDGIQQILQAGNGVEMTPETHAVAQITVQAFLRKFEHLSGMTGTARESSGEFSQVYRLDTVVIPPFRPCRRTELAAQVYKTRAEKWNAVVAAVRHSNMLGRPVLVGTRDLQASEEISSRLNEFAIRHQVLTARQEEQESQLVAAAGQNGMVTVSTNIAGRGTDIRLEEGVEELGGLHVIAADLFDAARIDRQLAGRGGRQGSPSTYQQILSLEDDVLSAAWEDSERLKRVRRVINQQMSEKCRLLQQAQRILEQRHARARYSLLKYDRERIKRHRELGFDPYLDDPES